jgi:hypothetical protein
VRLVDPERRVSAPARLPLMLDDYTIVPRFEDPAGGGWVVEVPEEVEGEPRTVSLRFVHEHEAELGARVVPFADATIDVPVLERPRAPFELVRHVPASGALDLVLTLDRLALPATWVLTDRSSGRSARVAVPAGVPSWSVAGVLDALTGTHRFSIALVEADAERYAALGRLAPLAAIRLGVPEDAP